MLLRWMEKSRSPIGLDIGGRVVRALQLMRRGESYRVMAAASSLLPADLPDTGQARDTAVEQAIAQILEKGDFLGKQVVSCLPAHLIQYKNLRLPRMPQEELAAAVQWEATDRMQLKADQAMVQFFNAGEVRQGEDLRQEVILMAASLSLIEDHARMLMRQGLQPLAIDAAPAALARAGSDPADIGPESAARFILDVGHCTSKALVTRHGKVVFFKLMELGGKKMDQAVATKLGLPTSEAADLRRRVAGLGTESGGNPALFGSSRRDSIDRAVQEALRPLYAELATEVGLCLRYYSVTFRGRRPEHVQLAGGMAADLQLRKALEEELKVTVGPMQPLARMDLATPNLLADEGDEHHAAWSVATGLSMRSATASPRLRGAA